MKLPRIREAGDAALLLELDEVIDPAVNARAIAIAAAIRRESVDGVRDVVPTYRTVAVHFDPLVVDVEAVRGAIDRASTISPGDVHGNTVEVPVQYGGEAGPDLDEVAEFAGASPEATVRLHADTPYRVFMLGFLPGFAYMGSVDQKIAIARRATPRVRVPAGSVGIAGRQTGVYPRESPGGWRLIGRTPVRVFDANRAQPCLFSAGDVVRFIPTRAADVHVAERPTSPVPVKFESPSRRHITVLRSGLFTTIQDRGRWGRQDSGVPVGGALDRVSHRVANAIVGNDDDAATLEVTLLGPEIRLEADAVVAIAGANLGARLDGSEVAVNAPVACRAGSVLRFGERRSGARAYVAFDGGIVVPPVLGSRATSALCALGGVEGRAVVAGDRLPLGVPTRTRFPRRIDVPPIVSGGARLRVLPGPQDGFFTDEALDRLRRARFIVTPRSDRMGYRLEGATLLRVEGREMISDAAFTGGIQVPSSGDPIVLVGDRQTTGGYPQIATVITADLPLAGQLAPGDWVEFEVCTRREALAALVAQEGKLLALQ
ncbi:MAG TPA: 5-oxoprolinase subunit PxpB [Vicinamibacterales bacterium]